MRDGWQRLQLWRRGTVCRLATLAELDDALPLGPVPGRSGG